LLNSTKCGGGCSIIEHDRITTPNVEHFLNTFQLTMLLLYIRVNFYFVQEITNFGDINTILIFTDLIFILHASLTILLINFFGTVNFITITIVNNIWTYMGLITH